MKKDKTFYYYFSWLLITFSLPYVSVLMPFIPNTIGGFNTTGWSWITMYAVTIYYLIKQGAGNFPYQYWLPWVVYLLIYMVFDMTFFGVQLTLQYILPILIGVVASNMQYDAASVKWFYRYLFLVSVVLLMTFILERLGIGFLSGQWAASSMFITITASMALGIYFISGSLWYLIAYGVFFAIPFMNVTRMGVFAYVAMLLLHFANRRFFLRIYYLVFALLMMVVVFNSREFQEKTFFGGQGEISDISLNYYEESPTMNTSGRVNFYKHFERGLKESPLLGNGPRADYHVMQSFSSLNDAHNDYLSVVYNYGYVGLSLFLFGVVGTFASLYMKVLEYRKSGDNYGFLISSVAATLFIPFLLFMYSDNILKYTIFFPDMFFALIGLSFVKKANETSL
ncbi:MAG: O-antigen ligase family protein [Chlorobiaceae bacterium]|nr:O-antigen ligase family protein [Chlorobiaceae bacterium]NTW73712.1 O-antigen ligase family protein [Chlorobiaceae bacterium]